MITFKELINNENLLKGVEEVGYIKPTTIQVKAIPLIKDGKDLIAKSNTGTGKTAAFCLPLLDKIANKEYKKVLVVGPTRELVMQAGNEVKNYTKYMKKIKGVCVYGGTPINRQIKELQGGFNILAGTPGRLLDLCKRRAINLMDVDCVVLDEADEMLNMGFREDIEKLLHFTVVHQSVMFSATMPKEIRSFAQQFLNNPEEIEVKSKQRTVDKITQHYFDLVLENSKKRDVLELLLNYYKSDLTIVFCNTKRMVDELVEFLNKDGVNAVALHGDIDQNRRTKIMANFKRSKRMILVASDVAARGIDVNNIDLVVNYDLPQDNETYVHRIGRTGRAGKNGVAVSLVKTKKDYRVIKGIMKYTKAEIIPQELPSRDDMNKRYIEVFKQKIKNVAKEGMDETNIRLANELVKEGLEPQEIISALISIANGGPIKAINHHKKQGYQLKNPIEVRINIGKDQGIKRGAILKAIKNNTSVNENAIGNIDVKNRYSIIKVEKIAVEDLLIGMDKKKINGKRFSINYNHSTK